MTPRPLVGRAARRGRLPDPTIGAGTQVKPAGSRFLRPEGDSAAPELHPARSASGRGSTEHRRQLPWRQRVASCATPRAPTRCCHRAAVRSDASTEGWRTHASLTLRSSPHEVGGLRCWRQWLTRASDVSVRSRFLSLAGAGQRCPIQRLDASRAVEGCRDRERRVPGWQRQLSGVLRSSMSLMQTLPGPSTTRLSLSRSAR
jgi:hypothetical protein